MQRPCDWNKVGVFEKNEGRMVCLEQKESQEEWGRPHRALGATW